jgi:glycine dehydrogenase subunit 2
MFRQPRYPEKLIFEYKNIKSDHTYWVNEEELKSIYELLPSEILRDKEPNIPNLPESVVVRHFTRLSRMNYAIDIGTYPLGSCTMKYNFKIMDKLATIKELAYLHEELPEENIQGLLSLLYTFERFLCEITGMDKFSFQPSAGAHAEFAGVLIIRKYHELNKELEFRNEIIVPDSAHGTNPASAAMAGFKVVTVKSNKEGTVDLDELKSLLSKRTAGLMLTNPNTLGLFEKDILEISKMVHEVGGLLYYDGANLNGIITYVRPGDMGFDIVHLNLHKTFGTPHGGGGPGAGPLGVKEFLKEFLPVPVIEFDGKKYYLNYNLPKSIGRVKENFGNTLVLIKALAYILLKGYEGLKEAREKAVENTRYFIELMKDISEVSLTHDKNAMRFHECLLSAKVLKDRTGVDAKDVAKRLLDYGVHPSMIYFPLIVDEALLIEFTEDETKENIEFFANALKNIIKEAYENPALVKNAPYNATIERLDDVKASHPRTMSLSWKILKTKINELVKS